MTHFTHCGTLAYLFAQKSRYDPVIVLYYKSAARVLALQKRTHSLILSKSVCVTLTSWDGRLIRHLVAYHTATEPYSEKRVKYDRDIGAFAAPVLLCTYIRV